MANVYGKSGWSLKFPAKEFDKKVRGAIEKEVNDALIAGRGDCEDRIKNLTSIEFLQSPETLSMIAGKLQAEFGFTDGSLYVIPIVQWIVSRIRVYVQPYRLRAGQKGGGYRIQLAVFDLDEIANLPSASYVSAVNYVRDIRWLEWLLSMGSKTIIQEFSIEYNFDPSKHRSRSKKAIMVRGRGWRVPSEFAGTITNNWITQTFDLMELNVCNIMENSFTKHLS